MLCAAQHQPAVKLPPALCPQFYASVKSADPSVAAGDVVQLSSTWEAFQLHESIMAISVEVRLVTDRLSWQCTRRGDGMITSSQCTIRKHCSQLVRAYRGRSLENLERQHVLILSIGTPVSVRSCCGPKHNHLRCYVLYVWLRHTLVRQVYGWSNLVTPSTLQGVNARRRRIVLTCARSTGRSARHGRRARRATTSPSPTFATAITPARAPLRGAARSPYSSMPVVQDVNSLRLE